MENWCATGQYQADISCWQVIQAGRFDQKTSADERRRILEDLLAKDEVCGR